jgi:AraC-like DNA-binding protein
LLVDRDLVCVAGPDRVRQWRAWVPELFPGTHVVRFASQSPVGITRQLPLGAASLWSIVSGSQLLRHEGARKSRVPPTVGLLFQEEGCSHISQGGNTCQVRSGDMCVIDSNEPFEVESVGVGAVLMLHISRALAAARFPELLGGSACTLPGTVPEVAVLHNWLRSVMSSPAQLPAQSAVRILDALLLLVSALPPPSERKIAAVPWRVRRALGDIDRQLSLAELSAVALARRQRVSRRRLDELFVKHLGTTMASQILEHRLTEAAARLCDGRLRCVSITSIAFDAGFRSGAHFSRTFKKRFGTTPTRWRLSHAHT